MTSSVLNSRAGWAVMRPKRADLGWGDKHRKQKNVLCEIIGHQPLPKRRRHLQDNFWSYPIDVQNFLLLLSSWTPLIRRPFLCYQFWHSWHRTTTTTTTWTTATSNNDVQQRWRIWLWISNWGSPFLCYHLFRLCIYHMSAVSFNCSRQNHNSFFFHYYCRIMFFKE